MLQKQLEKLNLNKNEALAYLALLELGDANIQDISQKSKIKRSTVYSALESLKNKNIISTTKKKKRTYYYAEDPRKIEELLDEKKLILKNILPELLSITNAIGKKPKIRFFEGAEGIKEVYRDTLKYPNQETLAWASLEAVDYFDMDYLWKQYVPKRIEKKIWQRTIAPKNEYMLKLKNSYDKKHLRQLRLAPPNQFPLNVEINLYGSRSIGIMSFKEGIGLIIESRKIHDTLVSIFEMNWLLLK